MFIARRSLALVAAAALLGTVARAQAKASDTRKGQLTLALTYATQGSNLTTTNRFWLEGGAAELNATFFHGVGITATALGLHTASTPGGVPVSLVTVAFGPSYTYTRHKGTHSLSLFAHGLFGETDGFKGLYPAAGAPLTSSNSLAGMTGGGVDLGLSHHLALRLVEADWVRSQLPNSLSNVQNSLRLGAGIVIR